MIRLRPAALILLAALPGAAWAACNPVGTEDCCTKVVTEECTSADWPLPGDIETSLTEDGRPRFILTGMPDSARYYGIRHETWIPVEPRITCPPDRETPIEGDIRTFVSWEMMTNDVVVATGFNTEAVVPDGISGLVRCDFEVHSFAGVCDEHSAGYTRSATVVRLEVTGGMVPRHSTNPEEWPELECYVTANGSENTPVSVTLTGSKIRFEPGHVPSKTISVSGSDVFSISGQTQSETMWDASVNATAHTDFGDISTNAYVTVYWVEPVIIRASTNDTISPNCGCLKKPKSNKLGPNERIEVRGHDDVSGNVVEIKGIVHPSDYESTIYSQRDCIDEYVAVETNNVVAIQKNFLDQQRTEYGNDPIYFVFEDCNPQPDGAVYNLDTPGCNWDSVHDQPLGAIVYIRYNFVQFFYSEGHRCSDDFYWFSRSTFLSGTPETPNAVLFYPLDGGVGDNCVGVGSTSITP